MGILKKRYILVMEIDIPRERKGEFEPQIVKNIKIQRLRIWKKESYPCTLKV